MQILIRVSRELKEELQIIAKLREQTLNGLIKQILWEWVKENEKTH